MCFLLLLVNKFHGSTTLVAVKLFLHSNSYRCTGVELPVLEERFPEKQGVRVPPGVLHSHRHRLQTSPVSVSDRKVTGLV